LPVVLDARTVTDHFPGIGRYVANLAGALAPLVPNLVLIHNPTATSTRLQLPDLPRLTCPISPFSIRQQWAVPRHLHRIRAALYHSPYYLMPYRPGVPTVFTCYDLIPLIYPEHFSAPQRLIYRMTHMLAVHTAQAILTISETTKADLLRHFRVNCRKIFVTPLSADPHLAPQSEESIAAVRSKYGLPDRYILYLGSNKPHKNLIRLIAAFAQSASKNKLVIAGHWDNRHQEPRRYVEQYDLQEQVVFAGPVSEADLPALYSGAVLFVFPSLYEGFGLPVLEAMACGAPVACSNTPGLQEAAGDAAILFDPLDVESLTEAIISVVADEELRQDLRAKGMAQAARFSWEQTAQATLAVYDQVMRGTPLSS